MFDRNCSARQNEFNTNFNAENMNVDVDFDINQNAMPMMGGMGTMMGGTTQAPIVEPMQERQVHRTLMHEVPQV